MDFKLVSPFKPSGDQPEAIRALSHGLKKGISSQVLLGVTGSGKTYTMANVIANLQKPALVISHNKTLAAQLYQEFRSFFPNNAVCYFVSYYDYYQPEAYIPRTDTYIEKETEINEEIDKLRLAATANLLTRRDTVIVASVSCIYNIGSPKEYSNYVLDVRCGLTLSRDSIIRRLVDLQYSRSNYGFHRGTFRVRGGNIDIYLAYEDVCIRIDNNGSKIQKIERVNPLDGRIEEEVKACIIYPAKHYMTDTRNLPSVCAAIRRDLDARVTELQKQDKKLESYRLNQKVNYDLEMIGELGYVNGIENYSRYFDGRSPGDPPYTLLDYFSEPYGDNWLLFIDESHMTVPQIRGMYHGDRARKQTLIDFGFRLPAALDNRPLKFEEFLRRMPQTIFVSATPAQWEISIAKECAQKFQHPTSIIQLPTSHFPLQTTNFSTIYGIVEQLVRPTGIIDPQILIRPVQNQIIDLVKEILARKKKKERVLVTTLTKRMAEDLSDFLNNRKYLDHPAFDGITVEEYPAVHYLHAGIETLKRSDILENLRLGKFDVVIGINLLREGLDLPEVSLVAILDADKEGFLRSETSLIQTMGRAARHINGTVILYAENETGSMKRAIAEIKRRRSIQVAYNKSHHITPKSIEKPVREKLVSEEKEDDSVILTISKLNRKKMISYEHLLQVKADDLTPADKKVLTKKLEREMKTAAYELNFELAAQLRDKVKELYSQ